MDMLTNLHSLDTNTTLSIYLKTKLCYKVMESVVEKIVCVGISGGFILFSCGGWAAVYLFGAVSHFLSIGLGFMVVVSSYCFVYAMGMVASANLMSEEVLRKLFVVTIGKAFLGEKLSFKDRLQIQRVKAHVSLKILYRPLGVINRTVQRDYVDTLKDRIADMLLVSDE